MRWIGLIAIVLLATLACKSPPPPEPVKVEPERPRQPFPVAVWKRVDGSPVDENEFARDDAICNAPEEAAERKGFDVRWGPWGGRATSEVQEDRKLQQRQHRACMAERGWVRVLVQPEQPPDSP
jgi:hypothetical protein